MLRTNIPIRIDSAAPSAPAAPARPRRKRRVWRWVLVAFLALFVWLAVTAPLSKSLEPIAAPSVTLLAADGTPIARRGAIIEAPTRVESLPPHVYQAFLAIEDTRYYYHPGVDPIGIARAFWHNLKAGGMREGGSTITQQLAKLAFLNSDRTAARKLREMVIALWLEAWLSKDEILSRYLSTVYFGDNVYGLRAAAHHYFDSTPEQLSVSQAAMLAGLVKAPSRLAPTSNLKGARDRAELVVAAMVREGVLSEEAAADLRPARPVMRKADRVPSGTWFADWLFPQIEGQGDQQGQRSIPTTLDPRLQSLAVRTLGRADLDGAQAALVAMRPDGRIVAMVGGTDYTESPFNRVTQARRQPGSTFKLFVYLAALESGLGPDSRVLDAPVSIDGWSPNNADDRYRGEISLRQAFAESSNVAAVRLAEQVGRGKVIATARRLGIESPLERNPSLALGTSTLTLLELTAAYAGIAGNRFPVRPRGLPDRAEDAPEPDGALDEKTELPQILDLLWQSANAGTGRAASLSVPAFGKTGTSQDNRDALFVGFVDGLVVGVWIGHDDNRPLSGVTGGGLPAEIWRAFVGSALRLGDAGSQKAKARIAPVAAAAALPQRVERRPSRSFDREDPRWGERGGRPGKGNGRGRKKGKKGGGKGKG